MPQKEISFLLIIVVVILSCLQSVLSQGPPSSPCPRVFGYQSDGRNTYHGAITWTLPNDNSLSTINLTVCMEISKQLASNYVGEIKMEDVSSFMRTGVLNYKLLFPQVDEVPTITAIELNGNTICRGRSITGPMIITVKLRHTFNRFIGGAVDGINQFSTPSNINKNTNSFNSNTGSGNIGTSNFGNSDIGTSNFGNSNIGTSNFGNTNIGTSNFGYSNSGSSNIGNSNTGSSNIGNSNIGSSNVGNSNISPTLPSINNINSNFYQNAAQAFVHQYVQQNFTQHKTSVQHQITGHGVSSAGFAGENGQFANKQQNLGQGSYVHQYKEEKVTQQNSSTFHQISGRKSTFGAFNQNIQQFNH